MQSINKFIKKDIIILLIAVCIFISSLVFLKINNYKYNSKPSVYYRTYTKEDGWSKWSKNGETSGNEHYITALQVKVKNNLNGFVYYNIMQEDKYKKKDSTNNQVIGDKKNGMQAIRIRTTDDLNKKYLLQYRISNNSKKWNDWADRDLEAYYKISLEGAVPVKYIQIRIDKR